MRRLLLLLFLTATALPAFGAKRVTVEQLEQTLAAAHSLQDAEVARQLSDLELAERLGTAKLDRLETDLPGEKSRQALMILADASAFLDPPAAEIPDQPTPDLATQRKVLALAVNYVTQTLHQLPNFFATRVTSSFEDSPAVTVPGAIASAYQPIRLVGDSNATVTFREGREVVEKSHLDPRVRSLTTSGVFGPILGTVLVDAARSKLAWSHWEQGQTGLQAVFSFEVPKENSNYTLTYDSIPTPNPCSTTPQTFSKVVAYHGEMAIDPASGTILRLMLLADMKPDEVTVNSGIEVEYGQVSIGGKDSFLPIRSVTSSLAHSLLVHGGWGHGQGCPSLVLTPGLQRSLNDVVFENYHVFRSDATVLTESEAAKLGGQPSPPPNDNGSNQAQEANASPLADTTRATPLSQNSSQAAPSTGAAANSANPPAPSAQPAAANAASTTAGEPSAPVPQATTATNAAAEAAPSAETEPAPMKDQTEAEQASLLQAMPSFQTNARDVVVDVVVTKSNGDPVLGLNKQDFAVTEDGKPQAIDFLEEHTAEQAPPGAPQPLPKLPPNTYTNVPPVPESESVNVLLLDTLNTPQPDQAYVHSEITDFLKKMQPGTRVAIFALGSKLRYVQGFTTDTSVLLAALNDKRNGAAPVKQVGTRDSSDQADDAADAARLTMMQSAGVEELQAAQGDMSAFDYGARASLTFEALNSLARYLAGVPGRKNLIWFASSFPVVIFPTVAQRASIENAHNMRGYMTQVRKTADMLTVSQVSVYPVSAEGVMTEHIMEADSAGAASPEGSGHMGSMSDATMNPYNAGAGGRADTITAMQQLAASTGGKAYFNTNDLNGALKRAINDGANYYTLSYSPTNTKMDGSYRNIEVRLPKGHYTVAFRHGYNADSGLAAETDPGTDPLGPLLKLGLPSATGLLYGVRVAPATPQPAPGAARAGQNPNLKGPFTRYNVDFFIRWTDVDFQTTPQGNHSGQILIGLKAYDRDGNAVNWDGGKQAMMLKPATFSAIQKSGIPADMEIDLPDEDVLLVTGVYDWNTGNAGTLEIHLHPGPTAAKTAVTGR